MDGAGTISRAIAGSWLTGAQGALTDLGRAMGSVRLGRRVAAETLEALARCLQGWFGEGEEMWAMPPWRRIPFEETNAESSHRQSLKCLDGDWYEQNRSQGNSPAFADASGDVIPSLGATKPRWLRGSSDVLPPAFERPRTTAMTAERHCRRHVVTQGGRG